MVGNFFATIELRVRLKSKITQFLNAILGFLPSKHAFPSCFDSGLTSYYSQRVPTSTHHPKQRLIGELGIIFDCRKHTEDEADQHQHEPETKVNCKRDVISDIRASYGGRGVGVGREAAAITVFLQKKEKTLKLFFLEAWPFVSRILIFVRCLGT